MGKRRFKELGEGSFFGEMIYDRAVPEDHALRRIDRAVDWMPFTEKLVSLSRGESGVMGRPPYDPVVILKMLLLCYLYDMSHRRVESYVNDSLSAKWFLGVTGHGF